MVAPCNPAETSDHGVARADHAADSDAQVDMGYATTARSRPVAGMMMVRFAPETAWSDSKSR